MSPDLFFQYLFAGITYGSIYAVVAIGFNIIYNATGIINFAQGEFVMLGGMIAISLLPLLPLPLAVAAAVAITMAVGGLIEVLFIRWLESPSVLRMLIITIGISILLRESALHLWGESIRSLPYFYGNEVTTLNLGSVHLVAAGAVRARCLRHHGRRPAPVLPRHPGGPGCAPAPPTAPRPSSAASARATW